MKTGNNTYQQLGALLQEFRKTDLDTLSGSHFRKRYEKKFILHKRFLEELLLRAKPAYVVLDVNNIVVQPYSSFYFDTSRSDMFMNHHNSRFPRYKIRYRKYFSNEAVFLEIKKKDNKARTHKQRKKVDSLKKTITGSKQIEFVQSKTPYEPSELHYALANDFYRITMAEEQSGERITLDTDISFYSLDGEKKDLEDIVVIEIKTGRPDERTAFERYLPPLNRVETSFSKYCIGRIYFDPGLKYNNFKPVLDRIERLQNSY